MGITNHYSRAKKKYNETLGGKRDFFKCENRFRPLMK